MGRTLLLPSDRHMGFSSVESIGRLILLIVQKFWRICSAAVLILILLYWAYGGIIMLVLLCITIFGVFYQYQDSLLYFPEQPESARVFVQAPNSVGLPSENISLKTADGYTIVAYFIKQPPDRVGKASTMLYFHGNAGNIGHRLHNAQALYQHCGVNILLVEYRGYGKSEGTPSELGLRLDAQAAMDYLLRCQDIDRRKIILFGRSLGGAVAIDLASNTTYSDKIMALVLENTFTSIPAMAQQMFPGAQYLPLFFFRNQFLSITKIKMTRMPSLFLSGLMDQLIPSKMMMELYQYSGTSVKFLDHFENGTHNATWTCYGYYESINRFIGTVTNLKGLSNGGKTSSPLHTSWESPPSYQQAGSNTNNTKYGSGNTNTNNNPVNTTGRSLAEVWNV